MSDLQRQIDELEEQTELFQLVVDLQKKQLNDVNYKNVLLEANLQMSLKREKGLEETINTPPSPDPTLTDRITDLESQVNTLEQQKQNNEGELSALKDEVDVMIKEEKWLEKLSKIS